MGHHQQSRDESLQPYITSQIMFPISASCNMNLYISLIQTVYVCFYESICTCNQHHPQKVFLWSRYWSPSSPTSKTWMCFLKFWCREGGSSTKLARASLCTSILGIFHWSRFRFVKAPCQLSHFLHLGGSLLDLDVRCELFDVKTSRPQYQPLT